MNEGCSAGEHQPPDDRMLQAQYPAAVIAGNVETSQIVPIRCMAPVMVAAQAR